MNRRIITFMLMLSAMVSCTQRRTADNPAADSPELTTGMDAFLSFAGHFSETTSFAFANVSGCQVLLVSQETFGNNENPDMEAIEASVFALDGKLMVAGHQFVRIYSIRGEVPEIPYTFSISPPQRGVFLCPHLTTFPSPSRLTVLPPLPVRRRCQAGMKIFFPQPPEYIWISCIFAL